jgi:hypothetical protein
MSDGPITDAPEPSDEQDAPAPERPADEGSSTDTTDEPEGG